MKVLVTGGCGYIGSVLVPRLQARGDIDAVRVFDSLSSGSPRNLMDARVADGFSFRQGDVREYGDVESAMRGADAVVHLAAITGASSTHDRAEETRAVNLQGTENVLKAARKFDVGSAVIASSCNVYGRAASTDLGEDTDPDPINPYAETKLDAERLLAEYATDYGIRGTALRMSTNYGHAPGMRFNLVVNGFVFRALTDRPLTVYGDGSNWRPFIHVEDAARAFERAVCDPASWPEPVYNVGRNEENYRISEIASIVREEANPDVEITYLGDKHPGPSYHVNFDRVATAGFEPAWTLREGVRDLIERFGDTASDH
jgi:nucleoside-diphosphate-sugar epimerase